MMKNTTEARTGLQEDLPSCVVGLYSFPRSGNTWLRQIIASAMDIPHHLLYRYMPGMPGMHLGRQQPIGSHPIIDNDKQWIFYKSHHKEVAKYQLGRGIQTDKVVYIYRYPVDVFISLVNYLSQNVGSRGSKAFPIEIKNIESLTPEELAELFSIFMTYGTLTPQNRVYGGWFEHVSNAFALRDSGFPIHVLRYEDLLADFAATASKIFEFLEISVPDIQAIFAEADKRTAQNGKFFWKRQAKAHEEFLTKEQIKTFNERFRDKLAAFGYPPE